MGEDALDGVRRAMAVIDALPKPTPMTIVTHKHLLAGKVLQMLDDGHLYAFMHPDDLKAIPPAPASILSYGGIPVREFDDEMRAVFVRGLERLAQANSALTS